MKSDKMFKIQDNEDGSTSIYCKNSGNLLCKIPGKRNCSGPRRINVVEPQPAVAETSLGSNWHHLKRQKMPPMSEEPAQIKEEDKLKTRQSKICLSPIPITVDGDQSEDYFDDCITQDEFAKCLNLVSKEKLRTECRENLLAEYPLRLLSRSKAYRTLEDFPSEDLRDMKLPDDMPLTSCLGLKILHLNESRNFSNEQKMSMSLKSYENYCRIPFNATKPSSCHFPKLRCREKKSYPISALLKSSKHEPNHFYTYGRRQRLDRIITLQTGLDARSRRLLRLCHKKKCVIKLGKLSKEEIESWRSRNSCHSSTPGPSAVSTASCSAVSRRQLDWRSVLRIPLGTIDLESHDTSEPTEEQKRKTERKCSVILTDVTKRVCKRLNSYYIVNTSIHIPFYEDFISSLKAKRMSLNGRTMTNGDCLYHDSPLRSSMDSDNGYSPADSSRTKSLKMQKHPLDAVKPTSSSYSRASSSIKVMEKHKDGTNCVKVKRTQKNIFSSVEAKTSRKNMPKSIKAATMQKDPTTSSVKETVKSDVVTLQPSQSKTPEKKDIPYIDLTEEKTPPKESTASNQCVPIKSDRLIMTHWKFRCFGCGFQRFYYINTYHSNSVEKAVQEHMEVFHSVMEPESFLSRYLDRVNRCTVIEAFPSYKGNLDDGEEL